MFWGIMLVIVGVLLVVNKMTSLSVPIFQVCVGVALVYWGLSWIAGSFKTEFSPKVTDSAAVFAKGWFTYSSDKKNDEYNVVFGNGVVDLRNVDLSKGDVEIEVNSVFGQTTVVVTPGTAIQVQASTVFGRTDLPDGNVVVVGKQTYGAGGTAPSGKIILKTNTVFGNLKLTDDIKVATKHQESPEGAF